MMARVSAALFYLGVVATVLSACSSSTDQKAVPSDQVPERDDWHRYVMGGTDGLVYPKSVQVVGDASAVDNPEGLEAEGGAATVVRATGPGTPRLVLDLGINAGGYVEVGITQTDGTEVLLGYSEYQAYLTSKGDNCGCGALGLSAGVSDDPEGRSDTIDSSTPVSFQSPGIRGAERWIALELEGAGTVSIDYVRVRDEHMQPSASDYTGHFLSSDETLNRVWYSSAYTFTLDTFKDLRPGVDPSEMVVTDGAKRDRLIWLGDLAIENLLGNYAFDDARKIMKQSIAAFSCLQASDGMIAETTQVATICPDDPPPAGTDFPPSAEPVILNGGLRLPEYTAWWVVAVHDYFEYAGDADFAGKMMPVVRTALAYFEANLHDGLYATASDGLTINWHPFDTATGEDAHTNATLYRALLDGADLERAVGTGDDAATPYESTAATVKQAMLARLWDDSAGAFVVNSDNTRKNHTQDAQVEAVLADIPSADQTQRALQFIDTHLKKDLGVANGEFDDDAYMSNYISPYISSTELLARVTHGDTNGALDLIRTTWGHMLDSGPGTLWEKMAFSGDPANYVSLQAPADPFSGQGAGLTSLAHGWSGGPVPALSGYVLGIRPVGPGYQQWIVAPQPGDLAWAQGQAPTPHGPITSRWERGDGDSSFKLTVIAPDGTSGDVGIPLLSAPRTVTMDGQVVWAVDHAVGNANAATSGDTVTISGVSGSHTFAWAD